MPLRVAKLTFRRRPMCATLAFASRRVISPRRTIRPFLREESAECVPFQEEVGLDVLVHGQFQHNDTVEYFGQIERLRAYCAARTRSDDYRRKIKPFFGPYQLRKLPEA
jgi:methionine synthase II (cobalamin-independent)